MVPTKRILLWLLCVVAFVAFLLAIIVQFRSTRDESASITRKRSIWDWPGTKTTTASQHQGLIERVRWTGINGVVVLPKSTSSPGQHQFTDPYSLGIFRPEVCKECHESHWQSCQATAHFRTSASPSPRTILGSFEFGKNKIQTNRNGMWYELISEKEGFYQELYIEHKGSLFTHRARFDIVIGSGNLGQSYLYWDQDSLWQLPVSYYSGLSQWAVSPGHDYPDGSANFARPIAERCLDCHATWFDRVPGSINRFSKNNHILGISCTRCHGSANEHIDYHRSHPNAPGPHRIVNPSKLSRDVANSICSQCHAGEGKLNARGFAYQPGEPLSDYLTLSDTEREENIPDVHAANQIPRLRKSQCYQNSEMTCFTCHDPHQNEHHQLERFVNKCMVCHKTDDCPKRTEIGESLDKLCIDCHMPSTREFAFSKTMRDERLIPLMRDHWIKVWPEATRAVLAKSKSTPREN